MEAVGVFHNEFPAAKDAESRAKLVAKLETDLVEVYRELLIGFDFTRGDACYDFLGGRGKDILPAVSVLEVGHSGAVIDVPAGLLPEFNGLHRRHKYFLGACLVHLVADDVNYLKQTPPAKRQIGICPAG